MYTTPPTHMHHHFFYGTGSLTHVGTTISSFIALVDDIKGTISSFSMFFIIVVIILTFFHLIELKLKLARGKFEIWVVDIMILH